MITARSKRAIDVAGSCNNAGRNAGIIPLKAADSRRRWRRVQFRTYQTGTNFDARFYAIKALLHREGGSANSIATPVVQVAITQAWGYAGKCHRSNCSSCFK